MQTYFNYMCIRTNIQKKRRHLLGQKAYQMRNQRKCNNSVFSRKTLTLVWVALNFRAILTDSIIAITETLELLLENDTEFLQSYIHTNTHTHTHAHIYTYIP